jgi:hypothetical protein
MPDKRGGNSLDLSSADLANVATPATGKSNKYVNWSKRRFEAHMSWEGGRNKCDLCNCFFRADYVRPFRDTNIESFFIPTVNICMDCCKEDKNKTRFALLERMR